MMPGSRSLDYPLGLKGVDRFTLPVRDLDKAELFYTQVMGADVVARGRFDKRPRVT